MFPKEFKRRNGPFTQTWVDYGPGAIQLMAVRKDCEACDGSGRIKGECPGQGLSRLCSTHDCEACHGIGSIDVRELPAVAAITPSR